MNATRNATAKVIFNSEKEYCHLDTQQGQAGLAQINFDTIVIFGGSANKDQDVFYSVIS